jgi:hypothetical protein
MEFGIVVAISNPIYFKYLNIGIPVAPLCRHDELVNAGHEGRSGACVVRDGFFLPAGKRTAYKRRLDWNCYGSNRSRGAQRHN